MPKERRSFGTDGIHNRANIIHPLFERRRVGYSVGQPLSSFIESNDPGELREATQKSSPPSQLMLEFNVRHETRDQNNIEGPSPITW